VAKKLAFRWVVSLVALGVLALFAVVWLTQPNDVAESHWDGSKSPRLVMAKKEAGRLQVLEANTVVLPGDLLQLSYTVGRNEQGAILSLDGRGTVTVHLAQKDQSVSLRPGAEHPVDLLIPTYHAPSYIVFILVVAPEAFSLKKVIQTMKTVPWQQWGDEQFGAKATIEELPLRIGSRP